MSVYKKKKFHTSKSIQRIGAFTLYLVAIYWSTTSSSKENMNNPTESPDPEDDPEPDPESEPESGPEHELEPEPDSDPEPEPESDPEPEPEPELAVDWDLNQR